MKRNKRDDFVSLENGNKALNPFSAWLHFWTTVSRLDKYPERHRAHNNWFYANEINSVSCKSAFHINSSETGEKALREWLYPLGVVHTYAAIIMCTILSSYIFSQKSNSYLWNRWTNTRLVCTHSTAFFILNLNMVIKIWISKIFEQKLTKLSHCLFDLHLERVKVTFLKALFCTQFETSYDFWPHLNYGWINMFTSATGTRKGKKIAQLGKKYRIF